MTAETLTFLYNLLCETSVPASADEFEEIARKVATAKKELKEEIDSVRAA